MTEEALADEMQAVVCEAPECLQLTTRPIPACRDDEFLIRVRRIGVCATDMHIYRGTQPYLEYPRVIGHELAGEVVRAPRSSDLEPGDLVYVMPYLSVLNTHKASLGELAEVFSAWIDPSAGVIKAIVEC